MIEFARGTTPRIQRRIQSTKSHIHQNDSNHPQPASGQRLSGSANNSPIHLVYASSGPSRRSTNRQTTHSSNSIHNPQLNEKISCAHPDYHISAFLDEGMRPTKLDALLDLPEPSQKQMEEHGWNPDDRSLNIYVKEEDRLTLHRHPVVILSLFNHLNPRIFRRSLQTVSEERLAIRRASKFGRSSGH